MTSTKGGLLVSSTCATPGISVPASGGAATSATAATFSSQREGMVETVTAFDIRIGGTSNLEFA